MRCYCPLGCCKAGADESNPLHHGDRRRDRDDEQCCSEPGWGCESAKEQPNDQHGGALGALCDADVCADAKAFAARANVADE